jgi:hypothetical protein
MQSDSFEKPSIAKQQESLRGVALICLLGSGLGLLLILAGVGWSLFGGAHLVYSTEQAEEWEQANAALHAASFGHVHGQTPGTTAAADDPDAALAAARTRFERADAALQSARFVKDRLGQLLVGIGLAVTAAFGVGYLLARGDQS